MSLLVHLSDLHIAQDPARQALVFDKLVEALGRERGVAAAERIVVVITGDVFDSATDRAPQLIDSFLRLHRRVVDTLGGDAPTIVLPSLLSMVGLMHAYELTPLGVRNRFGVTAAPAFGAMCALTAAFLAALHFVGGAPGEDHSGVSSPTKPER